MRVCDERDERDKKCNCYDRGDGGGKTSSGWAGVSGGGTERPKEIKRRY
jgi:hypothetical protein